MPKRLPTNLEDDTGSYNLGTPDDTHRINESCILTQAELKLVINALRLFLETGSINPDNMPIKNAIDKGFGEG